MLLIQGITSTFYKYLFKPWMFRFTTPDIAHEGMIKFGSWSSKSRFWMFLLRLACKYNHKLLRESILGMELSNPIGLSAGLDKDAEIINCIKNVGFGLGTFGSMTAKFCPGNEKPWFHRLPQYKAMLIYAGLANKGIDTNLENLQRSYDESGNFQTGVSIARTNLKESSSTLEDGIKDFVYSFKKAVGSVNFIEINISCPNTFQGEPFTTPKNLDKLLTQIDKIPRDVSVTLKMPIDKSWDEFKALLDVILNHNIQAITISNLLKDRSKFNIPTEWSGNISGKPCFDPSNYLISKSYKYLKGRLVIIGVGGIFNAADAWAKITAGANLVEIASALMYVGPTVIAQIKRGLVKKLKKEGYSRFRDAVGVNA